MVTKREAKHATGIKGNSLHFAVRHAHFDIPAVCRPDRGHRNRGARITLSVDIAPIGEIFAGIDSILVIEAVGIAVVKNKTLPPVYP